MRSTFASISNVEAPGSSGLTGNSEGYSASSETNVEVGRQLLHKSLRSIVMSRTAFTLFHGFNPASYPADPTAVPAQNKEGPGTPPYHCWIGDVFCTCPSTSGSPSGEKNNPPIPNFTVVPEGKEYDGLLLKSFKYENETNITKEIVKLLQYQLQRLITFAEASVVHESEKKQKWARLDVALGKKDGDLLGAFVEVSLTPKGTPPSEINQKLDQLFWKKINQAVNYLALLSKKQVERKDQDRKTYRLKVDEGKTFLLCAIVMTRDREKGRIAMFACEPKKDKKDNKWRMALLWRKGAGGKEISKAFGYFVAAIKYMADKGFKFDVDHEAWEYMGPNCSKVTVRCAPLRLCPSLL